MARLSSRAFTLIELLVVIAIIGILMGLLFPVVGGAIDAARKAQAKNDATQIANAVLHYEADYGYLPTNSTGLVDDAFVKILTGSVSATNENPRRVVYLEVGPAKKGKSGTNASGAFVDPWAMVEGDKTTTYHIALDTDYDNRVAAGTNGTNVMKKVGVWNDPKADQALTDKGKINRRSVNSWD